MHQRQRKEQAILISSQIQACWITCRVLYKCRHVWFHSTFQNKGKILLTFSHIMGRKKPYRVHSSLHNRKGMGSRLKKVLSKDEKKSHFFIRQAPRSLMSFQNVGLWLLQIQLTSSYNETHTTQFICFRKTSQYRKIRFLCIPLEPGLLHPRSHSHFGAWDFG